jgi:hypothetical protein
VKESKVEVTRIPARSCDKNAGQHILNSQDRKWQYICRGYPLSVHVPVYQHDDAHIGGLVANVHKEWEDCAAAD